MSDQIFFLNRKVVFQEEHFDNPDEHLNAVFDFNDFLNVHFFTPGTAIFRVVYDSGAHLYNIMPYKKV